MSPIYHYAMHRITTAQRSENARPNDPARGRAGRVC
jgi:hypothetical protein